MFVQKVIIENFQSHEYTEFELAPGLTVFLGESDRGKSAIIRALRWLFENEPRGTSFIRAGAAGARVTAIMSDGTALTRERGRSYNRYVIKKVDGAEEIFEKFGSEVPEEVRALHGVAPVKLDEDLHVSLNLSLQLEGPFLLSSPGSLKAKAIGRLHSVHIIDAALRDVQQEIQALQREENSLEKFVCELNDSLQQYGDLPELAEQLENCRRLDSELEEKYQQFSSLKKLGEQLAFVRHGLGKLNSMISYLARAAALREKLRLVEKKTTRLEELVKLQQRHNALRENLDGWRAIYLGTAGVPDVPGLVVQVESSVQRYQKLVHCRYRLQAVRQEKHHCTSVLSRVRSIPAAFKLQRQAEELSRVRCHVGSLAVSLAGVRDKINSCQATLRLVEMTREGEKYLRMLDDKLKLVMGLIPLRERWGALRTYTLKLRQLKKRTVGVTLAWGEWENCNRTVQKMYQLEEYRERLVDTRKRLHKGRRYLKDREAEVKDLAFAYGHLLKSLGRCPTCYSIIDRMTLERIIAQLQERSGKQDGQ